MSDCKFTATKNVTPFEAFTWKCEGWNQQSKIETPVTTGEVQLFFPCDSTMPSTPVQHFLSFVYHQGKLPMQFPIQHILFSPNSKRFSGTRGWHK